MAKFYGPIGFAKRVETRPGVWEEQIIERNYYADEDRNSLQVRTSDEVNDDVVVSIQLSILADPFAKVNSHKIRYVRYAGTDWKVTSIQPKYPRLILTLGGIYNGKKA